MEYELYHHGILGMKWGIRRYQNNDGSLTAAGKLRYRNLDDGSLNEEGKKYYDSFGPDEKKFQELIKKDPSQLSTQDLQFINNRIQAKNQFYSNTESQFSKIAKQIVTQTVSQLGAEYVRKGAKYAIEGVGKKISSSKDTVKENTDKGAFRESKEYKILVALGYAAIAKACFNKIRRNKEARRQARSEAYENTRS